MSAIDWEGAFCGEGNNCFRLGTDAEGNSCIAVAGDEAHVLTDSREALAQMIRDIKAGKTDHLLQQPDKRLADARVPPYRRGHGFPVTVPVRLR